MTSYVEKGLGLMIRKSGHSKKTRCPEHGRGNHPPAVPSLIWDVQRHVTPPSTQGTRSETPTFAGVSEAWPCFVECVVTEKDTTKFFLVLECFPWTWYICRKLEKVFGGVVVD